MSVIDLVRNRNQIAENVGSLLSKVDVIVRENGELKLIVEKQAAINVSLRDEIGVMSRKLDVLSDNITMNKQIESKDEPTINYKWNKSETYVMGVPKRGRPPKYPKETEKGRKGRMLFDAKVKEVAGRLSMDGGDVKKNIFQKLQSLYEWEYKRMGADLLGPSGKYNRKITRNFSISILRQNKMDEALYELEKMCK